MERDVSAVWQGVRTRLSLLLAVYAAVSLLRWWDADLPVGDLISPLVAGTIGALVVIALFGRTLAADLQQHDDGPAVVYAGLVLIVTASALVVEGALLFVGIWLTSLIAWAVLDRRRRAPA